jgi:putative NADH-flavin reductase
MKIAVVGATGMVGSSVTAELITRGDEVVGIARTEEKLRKIPGVIPRVADVMQLPSITEALRGHDAVVFSYAPGPAIGPAVYKSMVEAGWKIKRAFCNAKGKYLIIVGGASSLWGPSGQQMFEDPRWPSWYFNTASPEHLRYLRGMTKKDIFEELALTRERILADPKVNPLSDWPEEHQREFIAKIAENHDKGEGGRAQFELFANDHSFRWSYISPPWFMRPGPRTGHYQTTLGQLPMDGDKPAGITVDDLAVAIADEVHAQNFVHAHWCAARP